MTAASEITRLDDSFVVWQTYDPAVKAELFSTACSTENGLLLFDPIPLRDDARLELASIGQVAAVILTNANHARAARAWNAAEMFVPAELGEEFPHASLLRDGESCHALTAIALPGAAPGEFALHDARAGGSLIIGDAIINFEPHGFSLLPAKYCTDRKKMIRALRRLLEWPFRRIFFAHGSPVLVSARNRLNALLSEVS